jgi:hypothetical protein
MMPVEPINEDGSRLVVFAKDQPGYIPLPTLIDEDGVVTSEWVLTPDEINCLLRGGRIRLAVHTFDPEIGTPGHHLQPVRIETIEPELQVKES